MPEPFPIIDVAAQSATAIEAMGSKPKFWFRRQDNREWLFKESRRGTGEDWAEKIAAELASTLGVPHAVVELATWSGRRGTVSPKFVSHDSQLVHGNEILVQIEPAYPGAARGSTRLHKIPQHTVELVLAVNGKSFVEPPIDSSLPAEIRTGRDTLVGYLLLDAWIGNTDRHHENWAWVVRWRGGPEAPPAVHLAPTYDHAASLGRNESDAVRHQRLTTNDKGYSVEAYATKAQSGFYAKQTDPRPLTTFGAFREAGRLAPEAAQAWLAELEPVTMDEVQELLSRLPTSLISQDGLNFALKILEVNQQRLLALREEGF